ncbi:MAG: acetylxylan esterase [Anaerolineae bacterium]
MAGDGGTAIRHTDTVFIFPGYGSREQWQARKEHLRRRILIGAGLWPSPEREPLNPRVTGGIEHDDYTIENVYFESYPGFFVAGNLYRPKGKQGPFPAVLCPHGHWDHGRLEDTDVCSVPGRCISFARRGYVAFAYDMVGYNDSGLQVPHTRRGDETIGFWDERRFYLWGVSLLGLQLWNGMRALDFLATLPDVDAARLACTGASGGGTQTFLLAAVDDRIRAAAPVNMISAHMQGGCLCENAPGLRLDAFNVEFGAMMAPRPMMMVSATGDWTADTPRVEYPAIQSIYRLFGAAERLGEHQVDAGHNYNRESREAVYTWFGRWLLGEGDETKLREQPFTVDAPEAMRVFPMGKLPANAVSPERLVADLVAARAPPGESLRPVDAASLQAYRELLGTAYRYAVDARMPEAADLSVVAGEAWDGNGYRAERLTLGAAGASERIPALLLVPGNMRGAVLTVHAEGKEGLLEGGEPKEPIYGLLARGYAVLGIDTYGTGEATAWRGDEGKPHFHTFNRGRAAQRVQDILTAIAYLQTRAHTVHLAGMGDAGLWCLLARALAPAVATTVVDAAQFDCDDDAAWAERLYIPHIRRAGDLRTAVALVAPGKLLVLNAGASFPAQWFRQVYAAAGASDALRIEPDALNLREIVDSL